MRALSQGPSLTVIVCTYNRLPVLTLCVEALLKQTASVNDFRILVVDNNCNDGTWQYLLEVSTHVPNMSAIQEREQGLSYARNRGLKEASTPFLAYLDDDGIPPETWVSSILENIESHYGGDIAAFGGPYFPYYLQRKPEWFKDSYGTWDGGPSFRLFNPGECICGGNMVLRTDVLREVGGFSGKLGMKGNVRAFAEESLVHKKILERKWQALYCPNMRIAHLVKPTQFDVKNLLRDAYKAGFNSGQIGLKGRSKSLALLKVIATVAAIPLLISRNRNLCRKSYLVDVLMPLSRRLGAFIGQFSSIDA